VKVIMSGKFLPYKKWWTIASQISLN
jgi:hypothetical protein